MAKTNRATQLQLEAAADDRLQAEITALAGPLTRVVLRYATTTNDDGERIIPNRQRVRDQVSADMWREALAPYFGGSPDEILDGASPRNPFTRTLVEGVRSLIQHTVAVNDGLLRKAADQDVYDWLTGPRPLNLRAMTIQAQGLDPRKPWYDAFHLFVDADGYRLSDRGWRTATETRQAIDNLMAYEISRGTSAVKIADRLEPYLWPEAAAVRTETPYGEDGSYWARRLARTEITAAAGRSMINAALANPFVAGVKWNLSLSHPCCDVCDDLAAGGENGDGVYPVEDVPRYPAHPNDICYLTQEVTPSPAEVNATLRQWIDDEVPEAQILRGAFNTDWLLNALLNGDFMRTVFENELFSLEAVRNLATGAAA